MLKELDEVRVIRLASPTRAVDGTESVRREPQVGDTGVVVSLYPGSPGKPRYYVECVDRNGLTVWLTDFDESERAPTSGREPRGSGAVR